MRTLALVLLLGACVPSPPVHLHAGDLVLELRPSEPALYLLRGGEPLVSLLADGIGAGSVPTLDERSSYDPYWIDHGGEVLPPRPPDGLLWHEVEHLEVARADGSEIRAELMLAGGLRAALQVRAEGPGRFSALLQPTDEAGRAVVLLRLRLRADSREGFYGLGEWPDEVNHRGQVRPMQMEVDVTESSSNENHVPVPLLLGTRGWGLFVQSDRVGVFAVATTEPDLVEVTYAVAPVPRPGQPPPEGAEALRFHLLGAAHPLDLLRPYFEITGYPVLPAPWALGPWIWRNESRDQAQVLDDIAKIRALDLATSAIWIDRPYATAVNTFDFAADRYPDAQALIRRAHEAGLRVALWHTPYLEPAAQPWRAEAEERGYFPPRSGARLNPWGDPIDLTRPEAYAFWQELIRRYTAMGIEGFKLDYGEDVVPGLGGGRNVWRFADGSDERTMHYGYVPLYHRVYAETLPAQGGFLLCRAGRWGGQRFASVIWPGDMDATFTRYKERFVPRGKGREVVGVGGLPATVAQGLGLSASGYPFFGADTGGYRHSPPDRELYIRWFQQTALSAVMQVGDGSSQPPWEFTADNGRDPATLELYRQYARLHLRLFPYEWTYAQRMLQDGRPIVRPLGLAHPELGVHPADTYLFGEDLLVAPVVERGQRSRAVVLPAGEWVDFWDGTVYRAGPGGQLVVVPAPLERLPLLLRAGALVPLLRPSIDTLAPATDAGVESLAQRAGPLHWRVVPGPAPTSFVVYDGSTLSQGPGQGLLVRQGQLFRQGVILERLRTARPGGVRIDGQAVPMRQSAAEVIEQHQGWAWEQALGGTLWVAVPPGDHEVALW
ncbi:MAG: glycoside hydrolase family 31 protein [Myxococcales bacterium]|nr:hypothetical protein [Myxococcota bacterium]MDW8284377.1 glycoside hydrolase family 31 protein [Myxococcales bacterium]